MSDATPTTPRTNERKAPLTDVRTTIKRPRHGLAFSDEDQQAALRLAARIGLRATSRELGVSMTALAKWRNKYPQLWSDLIQAQDKEQKVAGFADRVDELAEAYADVELEALDRAAKLIPQADGKELAALGRMLSQGRTTAVSTSGRLRGEPDERHELSINFGQIEAAMERLLGGATEAPALPVPNLADADADDR